MSIKSWNEDDRPREKFYQKGSKACSDSEILAILIGVGNRDESALDIAKNILAHNDNSIDKVSKLSVRELMNFKGIGIAKAITIAAALELGNRKKSDISEVSKIQNKYDAFHYLKSYFYGLKHEEFYILLLSRSLKPIRVEKISMGGTHATVVDIKIIVKLAIEHLAESVILAHNHPSGNLTPSEKDITLTHKIREALKLVDISLNDHLIIYEDEFVSING